MDTACTEPADPRVRRTRKALQEAFRSLLEERALSDISITDITERAQVNRATFYAHYADKDELARSAVQDNLRAAVKQRFPALPELSRDNLVELAVVVFEYLESLFGACPRAAAELRDVIGVTAQRAVDELLAKWLSESPNYARLFGENPRAVVATALAWSIYGSADRWIRTTDRPDARDVCGQLVAYLAPARR